MFDRCFNYDLACYFLANFSCLGCRFFFREPYCDGSVSICVYDSFDCFVTSFLVRSRVFRRLTRRFIIHSENVKTY